MSAPERLCVACGRTVAIPCRFDPVPDCPSPDACTLDMTAEEAWQYWRRVAHDQRTAHAAALAEARREALEEAFVLVCRAYNDGFHEGMREYASSRGGKPWSEVKQEWQERIRALAAQPADTAEPEGREGEG